MKRILLEKQDEAVKRFFLLLPADPEGFVIELNGVALVGLARNNATNSS